MYAGLLSPLEGREAVSKRPSGQIKPSLNLMFFIISLPVLCLNIKEGIKGGVEKDVLNSRFNY